MNEDVDKEPEFTLSDLENTFMAGVNRGCYISSVIIPDINAIDVYPTFEEYIEKEYGVKITKKENHAKKKES